MDLNRADSSNITPEDRDAVLKAYDLVNATPLAIGTEAEVYAYDSGHVLKIYADSSRLQHLETLRDFYALLDTGTIPLTLPKITRITRHDNIIATLESRIAGVPLEDIIPGLQPDQEQQAINLYLDAVFQLQHIAIKESPDRYLLFDNTEKSRSDNQSFNDFYSQFLAQKVERTGKYFEATCPGFKKKASQLVTALKNGHTENLSIVHGDFFPGNVLVDTALTAVHGVVDFGSFTLFGNYLLDVAGAFGFYRMYAPNRIQIRQTMLPRILERLTDDAQPAFFQYLLANAILTSDLYAPNPDPTDDAHFQWAAEIASDDTYWQRALR